MTHSHQNDPITGGAALNWNSLPLWMSFPPLVLAQAVRAAALRGAASERMRVNAGRALLGADRFAEALDIVGREPASTELATLAAQILLALGQADEALTLLDRASHASDGRDARRLRAITQLRRRDPQAPAEIAALVDDDKSALSWDMLAPLLPARGWAWVLDLLDRRPHRFAPGEAGEIRVRALLALARGKEARIFRDEILVARERLDLTEELPGFSDRLHAEIRALDSFVFEPHDSATRGGRQTMFMLTGNAQALPRLLRRIQLAVDNYVALRRNHPGLGPSPSGVQLQAQLVALDPGGFQEPHIHHVGWLSGVYYIAADPGSGELQIPLPPPGSPPPVAPQAISPQPGLLVVFPSHFRHGTRPHRGTRPRLSLAFDVVPADPR